MTESSMTHATIVVERTYEASPDRVFAAFADPAARSRWMVMSDDATVDYREADFRVGGQDRFHDAPPGESLFLVTTRYEDIVPDRRIVTVETVSRDDTRHSVSLITVELTAANLGTDAGTGADGYTGTLLTLTDQIVTPHGTDWVSGVEEWWGIALDRLIRELGRASPEARALP